MGKGSSLNFAIFSMLKVVKEEKEKESWTEQKNEEKAGKFKKKARGDN